METVCDRLPGDSELETRHPDPFVSFFIRSAGIFSGYFSV